jgi:hypothetical protein
MRNDDDDNGARTDNYDERAASRFYIYGDKHYAAAERHTFHQHYRAAAANYKQSADYYRAAASRLAKAYGRATGNRDISDTSSPTVESRNDGNRARHSVPTPEELE